MLLVQAVAHNEGEKDNSPEVRVSPHSSQPTASEATPLVLVLGEGLPMPHTSHNCLRPLGEPHHVEDYSYFSMKVAGGLTRVTQLGILTWEPRP